MFPKIQEDLESIAIINLSDRVGTIHCKILNYVLCVCFYMMHVFKD